MHECSTRPRCARGDRWSQDVVWKEHSDLFCAGGVPSVFWSSHPSSAQLVLCSFIHASSWLVCVTRARMSIFVMFRLCELIVFLSDLGRNTHRVH